MYLSTKEASLLAHYDCKHLIKLYRCGYIRGMCQGKFIYLLREDVLSYKPDHKKHNRILPAIERTIRGK